MVNTTLPSASVILSKNIVELLKRDYPGPERGRIARFRQHHKGIPLSKMQRAINDGRINLQTLSQLAEAFKVQPYQLLVPNLIASDPQIAIERKYFEKAKSLARELSEAT